MGVWYEVVVVREAWRCLHVHGLLSGDRPRVLWQVLCDKSSVSQRHEACGGESIDKTWSHGC